MNHIQVAVILGNGFHQVGPRYPLQPVGLGQIRKKSGGLWLNTVYLAEPGLIFGKIDRPELSCPVVEALKEMSVEVLKRRECRSFDLSLQ